MEFNSLTTNQRKWHLKLFGILLISLVLVSIVSRLRVIRWPLLGNPYIVMALEYVAILGTIGLIWYGYYRYTKVARESKDNDDLPIKQVKYIRVKRWHNRMLYLAALLNIVFFALTFKAQFEYFSAICLVFCAINFPSVAQYNRDFIEPDVEEHYETELNPQDESNIKQNLSSWDSADFSAEKSEK